jgi:hypothetical protein
LEWPSAIAKAAAGGIDRPQQQIRLLQLEQHGLAIGAARDGIAERPGQFLHERRLQQELVLLRAQVNQHLIAEVLEQATVGRVEVIEQGPCRLAAGDIGCRQLQHGGPAFSALREIGFRLRIERNAAAQPDELGDLGGLERQFTRGEFQEVAPKQQARGKFLRLDARTYDQVKVDRRELQQHLEQVLRIGFGDALFLVEEQGKSGVHLGTGSRRRKDPLRRELSVPAPDSERWRGDRRHCHRHRDRPSPHPARPPSTIRTTAPSACSCRSPRARASTPVWRARAARVRPQAGPAPTGLDPVAEGRIWKVAVAVNRP